MNMRVTGFLSGDEWTTRSRAWCTSRCLVCHRHSIADDVNHVVDGGGNFFGGGRSAVDRTCVVPRTL